MRKFNSILLIPIFILVVTSSAMLHAGELYCTVTLKGQNRNRTVAGAVNVECGAWPHSAPFGNWGVFSNYGGVKDTDQFRGWKWLDGPSTKKQWNSCTTSVPKYHPPNCDYYNANGCTTQASSATVTHGVYSYRYSGNQCPQYLDPDDPPPPGCSNMSGVSISQSSNYMTVYELDRPDSDDLVETLYFPGTSVTLGSCNYDGCPERTSSWADMSSSSDAWADVEAELRMKAKAQVEGYCDTGGEWDWD